MNGFSNIDYILANANEQVPEHDCNHCTIKVRICETLHSLPFQATQTTIIKNLATETSQNQSKLLCKSQQQWIARDEVSSPTVTPEATMLTVVIEALEG